MNCARMEKWILPYVDGRLKDAHLRDVEKHLAACAACRLRVNEFRTVADLLGELPKIEPSPAFDLRVRARVAAEPPKRSWLAWLTPSPRIAFAAAMLVLAVAWIGTRPAQQPGTSSPISEDTEIKISQDLPVLEDYDVLTNFEPLNDLPQPVQAEGEKN